MTIESHDTDEPRVRRVGWAKVVVIGFVLVLVAYPPSIGPMFVLNIRIGTGGMYHHIYRPLVRICVVTRTDNLLDSYCRWWLEITNSTNLMPRLKHPGPGSPPGPPPFIGPILVDKDSAAPGSALGD